MKAMDLCPGENISAQEIGDRTPTYTIKSIERRKLPAIERGKPDKMKGIMYFREEERGWVLNSTNVQCIARMFGDETDDWVGKRLTLMTEDTQVGPTHELGIRVKGSPDIDRPMEVEIKLKRKKDQHRTMLPTGTPKQAPRSETRQDVPPAVAALRAYLPTRIGTITPPLTPDEKKSLMAYFGDCTGTVESLTAMDDATFTACILSGCGRSTTSTETHE
jgi:hypothetical protein